MEKGIGEELNLLRLDCLRMFPLLLSCSAQFANQIAACLLIACPLEDKGREVIRGDLFQ